MRNTVVTPEGDRILWVEPSGHEPSHVHVHGHVHGLGATSPAHFAEVAVHPLPADRRSLLVDLLRHGISDGRRASTAPWNRTLMPSPRP